MSYTIILTDEVEALADFLDGIVNPGARMAKAEERTRKARK